MSKMCLESFGERQSSLGALSQRHLSTEQHRTAAIAVSQSLIQHSGITAAIPIQLALTRTPTYEMIGEEEVFGLYVQVESGRSIVIALMISLHGAEEEARY
jgi:hypothetical protein